MPLAADVDAPEPRPWVAWSQLRRSIGRPCLSAATSIRVQSQGSQLYRFFLIVLSYIFLFLVLRRASSSSAISHAAAFWASGPVSPPRSLSNCQKGALYIATNTAIA